MKKILIVLFLLCVFFLSALPAMAGNPFKAIPEQQQTHLKPQAQPAFFAKTILWQMQIRQKMADLIRSVQTTKRPGFVLFLVACAFAYGVIHATGPGHGKAVALSYILSCKPSLLQGLIFGNMVALTHGLSGILFILTVKFLFQTQVSRSLATVTHITQIVSFSLISLLGLIIIVKSIYKWIKKSIHSHTHRFANHFAHPYITALAIGIIPCPGVVIVMLFAISLNMTWLGILIGIFISIGMAVTVSCVVVLGISGKSAVLSVTSQHKKIFFIIEVIIEIMAGLMIMGLGAYFLITTA